MQISQFEAFVTLAKEKNFSRAADKLYITQPSLTVRIQSLEKELGHLLFERHGRTKRLTAVGNKLLPYLKQVLALLDEATAEISTLNKSAEGEILISIAGTPIINCYYLPKYLKYLCANANSRYRISLSTGSSKEVLHLVESGEIDVGFANSNLIKVPRSVICKPIMQDETLLVASPRHQSGPLVSPQDLETMRIIAFTIDSPFWHIIESGLHSFGIRSNVVVELDNFEAIKRMVIDDVSVAAFVPKLALSSELKDGLFKEIAIIPSADLSRHISILYLASREEEDSITTLINTVANQP
ncbi:MAG: LysR family transcriptional regulator [Desulfitobacteriaceae bacterium]